MPLVPMAVANGVNGRCQWPLSMMPMAATNGANGRADGRPASSARYMTIAVRRAHCHES